MEQLRDEAAKILSVPAEGERSAVGILVQQASVAVELRLVNPAGAPEAGQ